jgi:hypothetical protein
VVPEIVSPACKRCSEASLLSFVKVLITDIFAFQCLVCTELLVLGGAFAKLRKTAMSFVMSVCPSAHMEQLGSQ